MPRRKSEKDVEFDVQVGARIEAARKRRGRSARCIAAACGITAQQMYWYEIGRNSCPVRILRRIAAALDVRIEVLIGDGDRSPRT